MNISAYTIGDIAHENKTLYVKKTKKYMSYDDYLIGSRIMFVRKECGMSRAELSDVVDVTPQQIEKYEKGKNRISAKALFSIAKLFDKQVDWFLQDLDNNGKKLNNLQLEQNNLSIRTIKMLNQINDKSIHSKIIKIVKILSTKK